MRTRLDESSSSYSVGCTCCAAETPEIELSLPLAGPSEPITETKCRVAGVVPALMLSVAGSSDMARDLGRSDGGSSAICSTAAALPWPPVPSRCQVNEPLPLPPAAKAYWDLIRRRLSAQKTTKARMQNPGTAATTMPAMAPLPNPLCTEGGAAGVCVLCCGAALWLALVAVLSVVDAALLVVDDDDVDGVVVDVVDGVVVVVVVVDEPFDDRKGAACFALPLSVATPTLSTGQPFS